MITPLRKARESLGQSTYVVANAVDIHQSQYSRVESGKRRPSPGLALRIHEYFGGKLTLEQIVFPEISSGGPKKPVSSATPKKKPVRSVRPQKA